MIEYLKSPESVQDFLDNRELRDKLIAEAYDRLLLGDSVVPKHGLVYLDDGIYYDIKGKEIIFILSAKGLEKKESFFVSNNLKVYTIDRCNDYYLSQNSKSLSSFLWGLDSCQLNITKSGWNELYPFDVND